MYTVNCRVEGVSPLIQHRFPVPEFADLNKGGRRQSGSVDYSQEWKEYLYLTKNNRIFQPATHFEACMIKAATQFKIQGKRGKSYKDLAQSSVFVQPEKILHDYPPVEDLDTFELTPDADEQLYLDVRPVIVNRARVIRLRPTFKSGWVLDFTIEIIDDQFPKNILQDVLTLAGRTVGIGDHRPRFGRFQVIHFEEMNGQE